MWFSQYKGLRMHVGRQRDQGLHNSYFSCHVPPPVDGFLRNDADVWAAPGREVAAGKNTIPNNLHDDFTQHQVGTQSMLGLWIQYMSVICLLRTFKNNMYADTASTVMPIMLLMPLSNVLDQ